MEIPKEQILQLLQERGATDQVSQADQQLPEQVDPEQHSDLLSNLGLDPQELMSKFGGGLGGPLAKLLSSRLGRTLSLQPHLVWAKVQS